MKTKRRDVGIVALCGLVMATALATGPGAPFARAQVLRLKNVVGLADLQRDYTYQSSQPRPIFEPAPGQLVEWVEGNRAGGATIGCGPSGNWSTCYPRGGLVGFSDGSVKGYSTLTLNGEDGKGTTGVSIR